MKKQEIVYGKYKEEIIRIYRDLRREGYYYGVLVDVLEDCITDDEKVIPVHLNTGYKDDAEHKFHNRLEYADKHSLQDIIIVPKEYTYENTTKPYVSIEVKKPNMSVKSEIDGTIIKYIPLEMEGKNKDQINEEYRFCRYIIFTDCITWYFLKKDSEIIDTLCLLNKNEWKKDIIWKNLKDKISEILNESKKAKV